MEGDITSPGEEPITAQQGVPRREIVIKTNGSRMDRLRSNMSFQAMGDLILRRIVPNTKISRITISSVRLLYLSLYFYYTLNFVLFYFLQSLGGRTYMSH